ncbi:MAG: (d)CMP kinase [Clostridia bacterium]|nr:(d)CMP kinase [Clostridia bacterium]
MINIALDGPSGSGKSTVAKILSKKLDILYLDTGAMYRVCALEAILQKADCLDEESVKKFIGDIDLKIVYENGAQKTILRGEDVSQKIRQNEVSMMASNISSLPCVRLKMVEMQREVAAGVDCVLDGRDIGTYVLPDAKYKFFMTASPKVRAKRRYDELTKKGQSVDFETLLKEINQRDYNDSHRAFAPLKKADDAVLIDTTDMTVDEVVDFIVSRIQK